jgi:hypothetical protein
MWSELCKRTIWLKTSHVKQSSLIWNFVKVWLKVCKIYCRNYRYTEDGDKKIHRNVQDRSYREHWSSTKAFILEATLKMTAPLSSETIKVETILLHRNAYIESYPENVRNRLPRIDKSRGNVECKSSRFLQNIHSRSYTEDGGDMISRCDYVKSSAEDGGIRFLETFTIKSPLKMKAVCSSETLVYLYQPRRGHIPDDSKHNMPSCLILPASGGVPPVAHICCSSHGRKHVVQRLAVSASRGRFLCPPSCVKLFREQPKNF